MIYIFYVAPLVGRKPNTDCVLKWLFVVCFSSLRNTREKKTSKRQRKANERSDHILSESNYVNFLRAAMIYRAFKTYGENTILAWELGDGIRETIAWRSAPFTQYVFKIKVVRTEK